MVKFLTTNKISAELEDLIKFAQDDIIIVSPYLKVNQRLQSFIDDANRRRVRFTLIYGKTDMRSDEWDWINRLAVVETGFVENLHAKCYLSETAAIVTSMNLYDFSQQNNDEMGILVTSDEDPELYQEIYSEAQRLRRGSQLKRGDQAKSTQTAPTKSMGDQRSSRRTRQAKVAGYCIRGAEPIDFDPLKPLCDRHYESWAQFKNETYPEQYCHKHGGKAGTTYAKPLCEKCFREG